MKPHDQDMSHAANSLLASVQMLAGDLPTAWAGELSATTTLAAEAAPKFAFGSMFQKLKLAPFRPEDEGLIDLGQAMENGPDLGEHPSLPAGYTYLAQFIAHDLSFAKTRDIPEAPITPDQIEQLRSPFLDLDSLYGAGPVGEHEALYKDDLVRLKIGSTQASLFGDADRSYQYDLPRKEGQPNGRFEAIIGDRRNDDNLAVAQMHVAWLRFHNSVAAKLSLDGLFGDSWFAATRQQVVRHYQWIVLHDLLPRILDQTILNEVLRDGPKHFVIAPGEMPYIPVEFSLAAFRLGHSMFRDSYEWNRIFQSPIRGDLGPAKLFDLFRFTGNGNMGGTGGRLPSSWIIDWTRFFDFTGHNGIANNPKFNWSGKIDTTLAPALKHFNNFLFYIAKPEFRSLAVVDLVRGSRLGLPSGQDVAKALDLPPLARSDVAQEPHRDVLRGYGFDKKTPLWYYILKEAQVYAGGQRLGPVGSRIVAETFIELIRVSPNSILDGSQWRPDLGQIQRDRFTMTDLIVLANAANPLGS